MQHELLFIVEKGDVVDALASPVPCMSLCQGIPMALPLDISPPDTVTERACKGDNKLGKAKEEERQHT